jgi:hypothetical protein
MICCIGLVRVKSNRTSTGWAVVKTWCVPVQKVKQRGFAMCSQRKVFAQVKLLLAQHKVCRGSSDLYWNAMRIPLLAMVTPLACSTIFV